MKINLTNILLTIVIALALYIALVPRNTTIVQPSVVRYEKKIKDSLIYINRVKEIVKYEIEEVDKLIYIRDTIRDTVKIIQIQDNIIDKQQNVIIKQDTIINAQTGVIALKDSIIGLERIERKKQRRNVIKLSLVALGTSVIAILK